MRYGLTQSTAPVIYPVTLAQAKGQSHIPTDQDGEDSMIEDIDIPAATAFCENKTHRQFMTASWTMTLDNFPDVIYLPRPPTASVTSVKYVDLDGDTQTLVDGTDYSTDFTTVISTIVPYYNTVWPSTRTQKAAVTVIFVAGYGGASSVPPDARKAILLATEDFFIHRTLRTALRLEDNPVFDRLLGPLTVWEVA